MTFLRRLFSSDFRRAVAAEAAGEYAEAARHYALSGERTKVASMHLLRAERAKDVGEEIAALRDALRWADADLDVRVSAQRRLGKPCRRGRGGSPPRGSRAARRAGAPRDAGTSRPGEGGRLLDADGRGVRAYGKGARDKMEEVRRDD